MNLAYLMNTYPMTSTTFIRSEIEKLELLGQPVKRFSVRKWDIPLLDPDDIAEQQETEYLLTGNARNLLFSAALEPFVNFAGLLRTVPLVWHVFRQSRGGMIKHVNYLLQAICLRRRAKALDIDHIHVHFSTNSTTVAMLTHQLGGPKYSFTVHGPDELVDPKCNALRQKVANSAFAVAITRYCRERIEQEAVGYENKIRLIYCGIDLTKFPLDLSTIGKPGQYVCVGRLCVNKAQVLIPAAIAKVCKDFPHIIVDFIGDGEHRTLVEEEAQRHGVQAHVRLLGWRPAELVRQHISQSSALLLPSFAEGLPIVLMEAMALRRPVLTTYIAGIPELVDNESGWIFPAGSVDAIADALRASLSASSKTLEAMGAEGRRRVEAQHDGTRSAELLIKYFLGSAKDGPTK